MNMQNSYSNDHISKNDEIIDKHFTIQSLRLAGKVMLASAVSGLVSGLSLGLWYFACLK